MCDHPCIKKEPLLYPDPLRDELDTLRAEMAALRDARVVYAPARPPHPATEPAASPANLARTVLGEPDGPAASGAVDQDVAAAMQAGMDDFDRQLRETTAAAGEIDPS